MQPESPHDTSTGRFGHEDQPRLNASARWFQALKRDAKSLAISDRDSGIRTAIASSKPPGEPFRRRSKSSSHSMVVVIKPKTPLSGEVKIAGLDELRIRG